ncbi:MAG: FAD-dependent oxidoreductase [Deinococcales bacterium]
MSDDLIRLETDVAVVGGGVAGCMAAIPALEAGLEVVICDKGKLLERSGSVGGGVDHYLTVMETGPEWDTPEFLLKHIPDLTDGIVDMEVTDRVVREMPRVLRKLEELGVDFKDPRTGTYDRHRSFGLPGAYHINFDGTRFKHHIGQRVRRGKATVLARTMGVQVLVEDGRAYGVLAFDIRSGQWTFIRARAVVLSTGDVNRLSKNASGLAFDSWHCPYNTGDAQAMGYRAGATLANMEFTETTLTPKGFSTQGLNALVSLGAYFLNRQGERFMFRYDEKGENARRAVLADAVINEYLQGNGPIYLDCRHLPTEVLDHMETTLQIDRHTLPAFYRQKGIDFRHDPVEVSISELSIRRSGLYFRGSGIAVDVNAESSVRGLFSAGDSATVSGGIAGAATLGHIAGEAIVPYVRERGTLPDADPKELERLRHEAGLPLERSGGRSWRVFEDRVRETVTDYAGVRRTEHGLRRALETLRALARQEPELGAPHPHGLMRVHEARNIRLNAELLAEAALERQETRTGSAHWRIDYPETDDVHWRSFVLVDRTADGPGVRTLSAQAPLAAAFPRRRPGEGG